MIDISKRMREMRERIPPKDRSVGTMRGVAVTAAEYAKSAQLQILEEYADQGIDEILNIWDGVPGKMAWLLAQVHVVHPQAELILRDLDGVRERVEQVYLPVMEGMPEDAEMPREVYPLFYNVVGERWKGKAFFMPDCLGPASALNQWAALSQVNNELIGAWWPIYFETVVEVAKEKGKDVVDAVEGPVTTALIAATLVVGLGVIGYGVARGYAEGAK